ncbi:MAG: methionyl-tRNA formyltransferase, partial [Clostridia bacterium]
MSLRVVFMGTPDFARTSLSGLLESGHQVAMAVTQPDRKQGRGEKLASCEVKCFAQANNIPVIQPERIREKQWVDILKGAGAEVFVTCAYGQILPREILSIPRLGCINVHASLLPKYRGAAPISHAIINGEKETGVTTMMTDAGMDTGDILLQEKVDIPEDMDAGALHDLLKHKGAGLLLKTLDALEKGTLVKISQENGKATYAPLLKREDG